MGDTSPPRRGHALEGVSRGGRASPVHRPAARRRDDDRAVCGVRHLSEDRLEDLRPVQRSWRPGPDRPQSAAVSARQSAPDADRKDDRAAEAGVSELGRAQDPRALAAPLSRCAVPGHQYGARRPRPTRPGDAMFLFTDGGENASMEKEPQLQRRILESGVRVFGIISFAKIFEGQNSDGFSANRHRSRLGVGRFGFIAMKDELIRE